MVKKIATVSALLMFVLFANYSNAEVNTPTNSIELEKGKCDKCGEKKCDGKCDTNEESKAASSETKKGCCSESTSKSCASKKEESKK